MSFFPARSHLLQRLWFMIVRRLLRAAVLGLVVVVFTSGVGAAASSSMRPSRSAAKQLSIVFKPARKASNATLDVTVRILTHRLNTLGLRTASARRRGGQVVVLLPDTRKGERFGDIIGETGRVLLRSALCGAPAFAGRTSSNAKTASAPLPACTASSALTASNLRDTPSSGTTFHASTIPTDAALAVYPSTSPTAEKATKSDLLPAIKGAGQYARYLVGSAAMTNRAFASAVAEKTSLGRWVVSYTLTSTGTSKWEEFAHERFHEIVAVELDGTVESAPLIEPSQSAFVSFRGRGEIAGNLTELEAQGLALAMRFGPLPVRLIRDATGTVRQT